MPSHATSIQNKRFSKHVQTPKLQVAFSHQTFQPQQDFLLSLSEAV
jgi:hypothetical protein